MSISIEARKLAIIERLAEMEDEIIISQIENLIQPKVDIWDELNAAEQELVMKGIKDLEEGRRVPLEDALNQFRKAK
ncbi:MAG: hypothetical protein H6573_31925 [Lewinellaceae bacterium]|nr:hypothetical protein [Phaeodactylibacter sp.]MCB9352066.1 hypothetical protein [Lewinellaceae bacterium]